jgi:quinol-cytochrome oxidoreductase complex cytochrome b subunit
MTHANAATPQRAPGSLAQDLDMFVVPMLLAPLLRLLIEPVANPAGRLGETFFLALFVHLGLSLYAGVSGRLRRITWCALIVGWAVSQFVTEILPVGQVGFWLATLASNAAGDIPIVGPALVEWIWQRIYAAGRLAVLWPALGLVLLGLDVAAMHRGAGRQRSPVRLAIILAVALVAVWVIAWLASAFVPPPTPDDTMRLPPWIRILPPWHMLPFYGVKQAVPDSFAGALAILAAMLVPAIWPWARVEGLRGGQWKWPWRAAFLVFVALYVDLGFLGTLPVREPWVTIAQGLTLLYFAFFALPFVLGRLKPHPDRSGLGPASA